MKTEKNAGGASGKKIREILSQTLVKILCVVAAFCVWLYVEEALNVTTDAQFDLIKIETRYTDRLEENDLLVQSMSHDTVNVVLTGTKTALRGVDATDISAYVDLSGISEAGEYQCTVKLSVPAGFAASIVADIPVTVYVDKAQSLEFDIKNSDILFDSWSISSDCTVREDDSYVNIDKVVIEGTTLEIEKISSVKVRTQAMGMISTDVSSACIIEYLDENGKAIPGLNVKYTAYFEDREVKDIVAFIKLTKEKEVPLRVETKHGFIGGIVIEPSSVIVKGSPLVVDSLNDILVGSIDERGLFENKESFELILSDADIPEGITEITDNTGKVIADNIITAKVKINAGALYTLTVPAQYVNIITRDKEYTVADESVQIKVRLTEGTDETVFQVFQKRLDDGLGGITLIADARDAKEDRVTIPISVMFSADYESKIYETIDPENAYTVELEVLQSSYRR